NFSVTSYTFNAADNGVHTFSAVFNTPGASEPFTATDGNNPSILGSGAIQVQGLMVTSFTANPSGFTANFNKPIDTTQINLYDTPTPILGASDITVVTGATTLHGSVLINSAGTAITWVKTGSIMAAGNYTVTFRSTANGFVDLGGGLLCGDSNGVSA